MKEIKYQETEAFKKDFSKLKKKFRSLTEDFKTAKKNALELYHVHNMNNLSVFPIQGCSWGEIKIYKLKKFACKALKGKGAKSGIRIIYAFHPKSTTLDFLEMYYKGDKENESRERINNYIYNLKKQTGSP